MLSKKCKYALKALLSLAGQQDGAARIVSDIAAAEKIPGKFLESILLELKHHGLVQSKKGKGGGYFLSKPGSVITVGHVVRIIDGPLAPVPCVSQAAYLRCEECSEETSCGIRIVMKEVRDATANILDETTLEELLERAKLARDSSVRPGLPVDFSEHKAEVI